MAIAKSISTTYRPLLLATAIDGFPFSIFTISPTLSPFAWLQWVSLIAFQTALDPSFYQPVAACLNCLRLILIYDLLTEVNELWPASSVWKTKIVFISRFTHFLHQLAAIRIFLFCFWAAVSSGSYIRSILVNNKIIAKANTKCLNVINRSLELIYYCFFFFIIIICLPNVHVCLYST